MKDDTKFIVLVKSTDKFADIDFIIFSSSEDAISAATEVIEAFKNEKEYDIKNSIIEVSSIDKKFRLKITLEEGEKEYE